MRHERVSEVHSADRELVGTERAAVEVSAVSARLHSGLLHQVLQCTILRRSLLDEQHQHRSVSVVESLLLFECHHRAVLGKIFHGGRQVPGERTQRL